MMVDASMNDRVEAAAKVLGAYMALLVPIGGVVGACLLWIGRKFLMPAITSDFGKAVSVVTEERFQQLSGENQEILTKQNGLSTQMKGIGDRQNAVSDYLVTMDKRVSGTEHGLQQVTLLLARKADHDAKGDLPDSPLIRSLRRLLSEAEEKGIKLDEHPSIVLETMRANAEKQNREGSA